MNFLFVVVQVELLKVYKSKMIWLVFAAFSIAPIMGGFFMFILKDPQLAESAGLIGAKSQLQGEATWPAYFSLLSQMVAVGGIIIFGFVTSWIFGREYTDRTVKDLLALPYPRLLLVTGKYIASMIVHMLLSLYILIFGCLLGWIVGLTEWSTMIGLYGVNVFIVTMILTIALSTPVAFFACYGRGYLAPLGFVILMVVLSQLLAIVGYGDYFPWAIPALYSGLTGVETILSLTNIGIIIFTSIIGLAATFMWWVYADQY